MARSRSACIVGLTFAILEALLAMAVVILVARSMMGSLSSPFGSDVKCAFDAGQRSRSFCLYALSVGLVSIITTGVVRCAGVACACLARKSCGLKSVCEFAVDVAQLAWWGLAFALFATRNRAAQSVALPKQRERNLIIAASFFAALAFALEIVLNACCNCFAPKYGDPARTPDTQAPLADSYA